MKKSEKRKIAILIGVFIIIGIIYCFYTPNSVDKLLRNYAFTYDSSVRKNECMFTGGSVTSGNSKVNCKKIGIFAQDKSELLEEFGKALAQQLQQQSCVEKAVFYPFGKSIGKDDIFPDQCFFITQEKFSDSMMPGRIALKSVIRIWGGNAFSRHFYFGAPRGYCFLPETQHDIAVALKTEANGFNFSVGKSQYSLLAEEMSKSVAENIVKEFKNSIEKQGIMPDIPKSLYPVASSCPKLPFTDLGEFKLLCCGRRPFANVAVWQADIKGKKDKLWQTIKERLATNGWNAHADDWSVTGARGGEKIEIRELGLPNLPSITIAPNNIAPSMKLCVVWGNFIPKKTASALFEPLIKNPQTSLRLLITLSENMTYEQKQQVMKRAEASPESLDSSAWIILSMIAEEHVNDNKAREYLFNAKSAAYLETNCISKQTDINARLKKLGVKKPELLVPSKEDFRKLGIIALENTGKMQVEGKLNLPFLFYFHDKNKKLAFIRLTVSKSLKTSGKYKLQLQENRDASSSSQESDPAESCGTVAASFKINSTDGDKVKIDVSQFSISAGVNRLNH